MAVLIVDDNVVNRIILRSYFGSLGMDTLEAEDGFQAIKIATRQHPLLIMMDINMPHLDGVEATKFLKYQETTRKIPVVAVSAHLSDSIEHRRALAAGCETCLTKPLRFAELRQVCAPFLRPTRLARNGLLVTQA